MLPTFRGLAKCSRICSLYKDTPWLGLKDRVYDIALLCPPNFTPRLRNSPGRGNPLLWL